MVVVVVVVVRVLFGFGDSVLGKFLGNELLRGQTGGRIVVRRRMVRVCSGGCGRRVTLGDGMVFGLSIALKMFASKRSTACVAHETARNPRSAQF